MNSEKVNIQKNPHMLITVQAGFPVQRLRFVETIIQKDMGANLSVEETAYKQLDRELKSQNGNYMLSIQTFLDSCQAFDVPIAL